MTATTYRPGDFAKVDNELGVFCHLVNPDGTESRFFALLAGYVALADDGHEIGPVLGNIADIAKDINGYVATAHPDSHRNNDAAALDEVRAIHHEWGETDADDIDQLDLWERIGYALTRESVHQ